MATECRFRSYIGVSNYMRGEETSPRKLHPEELQELLSYTGLNEEFEYYNWYGAHYPITATLERVVQINDYTLEYIVTVDKDIPKHYIPTPFQILKDTDFLHPCSVSRE